MSFSFGDVVLFRVNWGGNYCGHNPSHPLLDLPEPLKTGVGGLPRVLTLAKERLVEYFKRPALLPTLNSVNSSTRQQRSERRESCVLVLEVLLKYCDLVSLRIGIPALGEFKNVTVDFIVHHAGLTKRRVERALRDLKKAGILKSVQPRCRNEQGEVRGLPAVRLLSAHFFRALGLGLTLETERKKAYKRQQTKKQAQAASQDSASTSAAAGRLGLLLDSMGPLGRKNSTKDVAPKSRAQIQSRKQELAIQGDVMGEHPDWGVEAIREEVARRLRSVTI